MSDQDWLEIALEGGGHDGPGLQRTIRRLLIACTADGPHDEGIIRECYTAVHDADLLSAASRHELVPIAAHALHASLQLGVVPSHWSDAHAAAGARMNAWFEELDGFAEALVNRGIRVAALKNAGIARGIYPCRACCPMGDIDLLIDHSSFRDAHAVLLRRGFTFQFRSPHQANDFDRAEADGGGEYWKDLGTAGRLWLELQWRPLSGRWIRPDQEPGASELLDRSLPIPNTLLRLLAPEDNLWLVALHTAKHSYVRAPGFRLHSDVDRIVRRQRVDWALFVRRVMDSQTTTPVFFSLAIPAAMFGTPIPANVLTELRPARWKERLVREWLRRIGILDPDQQKFGRLGFAFFMALLYDDARGLGRAAFPEAAWIKQHYGIRSNALVPFYQFRRLAELALGRLSL